MTPFFSLRIFPSTGIHDLPHPCVAHLICGLSYLLSRNTSSSSREAASCTWKHENLSRAPLAWLIVSVLPYAFPSDRELGSIFESGESRGEVLGLIYETSIFNWVCGGLGWSWEVKTS